MLSGFCKYRHRSVCTDLSSMFTSTPNTLARQTLAGIPGHRHGHWRDTVPKSGRTYLPTLCQAVMLRAVSRGPWFAKKEGIEVKTALADIQPWSAEELGCGKDGSL